MRQPVNQAQTNGGSVTFYSQGVGLTNVLYQWQCNGTNMVGATNASLTLTNAGSTSANTYRVVISNGAGSTTSSNATFTLITPPVITAQSQPQRQWAAYQSNLTLTVTASAPAEWASPLNYKWQLAGTDIWGATSSNYTILGSDWPSNRNYSVGITNVAGTTNYTWQVRVMLPGTVVPWGGADSDGVLDRPVGITNIVALAGGYSHAVALLEGGTVSVWGTNDYVRTNVPGNVSNVTAIACGRDHAVALKADGTVVAWGQNVDGCTNVPTNLTNAVAIAAGGTHTLAMRSTGVLTNWGLPVVPIPPDLTNVVAIAAGSNFNLALRSTGKVIAWGDNILGQTNVPQDLTNVVAISAGDLHSLALQSNGCVLSWGDNSCGQTNVPLGLSNVMAVAAGANFSMALRNDGTVVAWGNNTLGQTNVPPGLSGVKSIAAAGAHASAVIYSKFVQYPVDVAKDLLLIYNTNSLDSSNVCSYYLNHRPMVSKANVLGIGCTTNFSIPNADFTNHILAPVLDWLVEHPTKHPAYLILFLGVPSAMDQMVGVGSVSVALRRAFPGISPIITHINMNGTNDCCGYINKLESIGTNGQVVLSASAGGYGNTNFVVDNVRHNDYETFGQYVWHATNGLAAAGVPAAAVHYLDDIEPCLGHGTNGVCTNYAARPHITSGTNVAGYISWGGHSSLGADYCLPSGGIQWSGHSGWYVIETEESYNGVPNSDLGNIYKWFSAAAFGGTGYSNTPIGAVSHVREPDSRNINDSFTYFYGWASGRCFGEAAWLSKQTPYMQAVGDPLIRR